MNLFTYHLMDFHVILIIYCVDYLINLLQETLGITDLHSYVQLFLLFIVIVTGLYVFLNITYVSFEEDDSLYFTDTADRKDPTIKNYREHAEF